MGSLHELPAQRMVQPRMADFRGALQGRHVLVCGCGESLQELPVPPPCPTIGVNDVGRLFDPTYLVVVNPRNQFRTERFRHVQQSRAQALFTHLDLGPVAPPVVRFALGHYGGTEVSDQEVLHFTQNSPYVAVCLAAWMGARRIGLIGVDFTDHHFFARTGRHPLAGRLAQIQREYTALAEALRTRGVELVNLSPTSRLQGLARMRLADFGAGAAPRPATVMAPSNEAPTAAPRLFVVNHRFLSCGDVFADGLRHAAARLGLMHAQAGWDDPRLPARVDAFAPDLVLVVHGRRFAQKWRGRLRAHRTAVWLTDEPYEVDDTASWSGAFDTVFVNDPATLDRHLNAHYLPVCHDPEVHRDTGEDRTWRIGFVGGYSAGRERYLLALAERGWLGYVVGGPWRSAALRRLCLAAHLPPARVAELYRRTRLVINVFRETHHYNARATPAASMNPRVYEALACGALVLTQRRPEVATVFPDLPQFDTPEDLVARAGELLADPQRMEALRTRCVARLAGHAYADRLAHALSLAAAPATGAVPVPPDTPLTSLADAGGHGSTPVLQRGPTITRPAASVGATRPFTDEMPPAPTRHLLYHVWPVRGQTWRWNLDQLIAHIDLFNGRRIIGIVTDARSEPARSVQEYLAGHGCEFVLAENDASGEAATFPAMLQRVATTDAGEVSFYGHAKGVKYEPGLPAGVRRWAQAQYMVLLEDWAAVSRQLQHHAVAGMLRRSGRFRNHHEVGDWHYSGTFFWMRHDEVFRRRWQDVPAFYGGVEAWPGMHFRRDEAACLLLDDVRESPYQERFWTMRGDPALQRWRAARHGLPAPADLACPVPLEGHLEPRLEQKPAEYDWWLAQLLARGVRSLLVIGAGWGGEEWHAARRFHEAGRPLTIWTLGRSRSRSLAHAQAMADARGRFGLDLHELSGAPDDPHVTNRLPTQVDAVFIDGVPGYRDCSQAVALACRLRPALIGLHDIVDSHWHAQNRCCVSRLWAELRLAHATREMAGPDWGGIGVIDLGGCTRA